MRSCMSSIGSLRQGCLLIFFLTLQLAAFSAKAQLPELDLPSTLTGNATTAKFFGGATADGGITFSSSFAADQAYDILTEIQVEPAHVGSQGNLYVVFSLGNEIFMQDESGAFQEWDLQLETLLAASPDKSLVANEALLVADTAELLAGALSTSSLAVFLAYDSVAAPEELFFNASPIIVALAAQQGVPPSETLYLSNVSDPIIQTRCIVCHTVGGVAQNSDLVYVNSSTPDYQSINYNSLMDYIANAPSGSELILSKPQGLSSHGGGVQLTPGSEDLSAWAAFVEAAIAETTGGVGGGEGSSYIFDAVVKTDNEEALRKASLLFAGRLPTDAELAAVSGGTEEDLRQAIRALMNGDGFSEYLIESANDNLLTEAFVFNLFNIVDRFHYPNSEQYFMSQGNRTERLLVSGALALEPMMLIDHVVSNERPYSEILTADYIMLNPYSAIVYGGNVSFNDVTDFDEWREGEITEYYRCALCARQNPLASYDMATDYPHAGILNSPAFLSRFPSTETNRNRARSRWAYYFFLGVDIEGLSERTTDPDALSDEDNPTLNNPNCVVCHDIMDPVAGAFQNYGDDGFYKDKTGGEHSLPRSYTNDPTSGYQPGDTWYADMLQPGFGELIAPTQDNSIQWLAQEFVKDSRFGYGTVNFWYSSVMGRDPYSEPENPEDFDYASKLAAYTAEQELMQQVAADFVSGAAGNGVHNLKDLLVDLTLSDQFRADAVVEQNELQAVELAEVGTGKLLTPEQLNRKLIDVTGFNWEYGRASALELVYGLVYGGIDSFGITDRATELTTLMSTVVTAMANEISCSITANDFSLPASQRKLFPGVELASLPTNDSAGIIANVQHLHQQMLGEDLSSSDVEIQATYNLFVDVWNARQSAGKGAAVSSTEELCIFENVDNPVTTDPNQTLRSWAVVVNYLLRDYKFIHE
ncbi:MAG: DUF1588 domain-containing protein [Pseudomonadales bacterium]|nr:DUF1588 domain-containing protein [Pseudomonadales bacterium]